MTPSASIASASAARDLCAVAGSPQLSTDYLNRYGEVLMLMEMVPMDFGILDELRSWVPVGYRQHFLASQLRCADAAIAAYDALDPAQIKAFEDLCHAMNRLIATSIALLKDLGECDQLETVVSVSSECLRELMSRATRFINVNGDVDVKAFESGTLQQDIDAMFAA